MSRMVATQGCAGGWQHGLMVALPLPSTSHCRGPGLRLGPWQDLGQQELCVVDVSKGGGSEGRGRLQTRCRRGKVVCSRMEALWPGKCCDSWGHFGPPAPRELHPWSHRWDSGWIPCAGMSLVAWQWVAAWGAAPSRVRVSQPCQRWPQAAAGRSATLAMQEKEISRSRMTPRSWAATSLSLPSLIPSMGRPASIPPCQGSSQWAGCRRRLDCGSCAGEPRAQKPFCL